MSASAAFEKARLTLSRMGIAMPWLDERPDTGSLPAADVVNASTQTRTTRRLSDAVEVRANVAAAPITPEATPPATAESPAVDTVSPFTLMFWFSEAGWLVVSVVEGQHSRPSAMHAGLGSDLLQALTGTPAIWLADEAMSWPPAGSQRSSTLAEAKDMLRGGVRRWCSQQPVQDVLLLGDQVIAWLDMDLAGKPLASQFIDALGQRCLALPGWPDKLNADAKRALWRLIAALRASA
ncbi:MAG TPA: hypothetical protein VIM96_00560 [Pseudomonadales bacterium]